MTSFYILGAFGTELRQVSGGTEWDKTPVGVYVTGDWTYKNLPPYALIIKLCNFWSYTNFIIAISKFSSGGNYAGFFVWDNDNENFKKVINF